jgi:hypothetical protein
MSTSIDSKQNPREIQRDSRALAVACLVLMALLPMAVAVYWAVADTAALTARASLPAGAVQGDLRAWQRIAGAVITEGALAFLLVGMGQARNCFKQFSRGQVFTSRAVRYLKRFAGWTALSVLAGVTANTAVSIVLTINNPPEMRHLAVSIGSDQIFLLFFTGIVWLMAGVISQGQTLAEENATFI